MTIRSLSRAWLAALSNPNAAPRSPVAADGGRCCAGALSAGAVMSSSLGDGRVGRYPARDGTRRQPRSGETSGTRPRRSRPGSAAWSRAVRNQGANVLLTAGFVLLIGLAILAVRDPPEFAAPSAGGAEPAFVSQVLKQPLRTAP